MFKYSQFTTQDTPLYDFFLDDEGVLQQRTFTHYIVVPFHRYGHTPFAYRIHTGTSILVKEFDALGQAKNGHVLSKTNDAKAALQVLIKYHQDQIQEAQLRLNRHQIRLAQIQAKNGGLL